MLHFRNSGYKAVTDVTASKAVNFDHHGIDEEGPVPDMQSGKEEIFFPRLFGEDDLRNLGKFVIIFIYFD